MNEEEKLEMSQEFKLWNIKITMCGLHLSKKMDEMEMDNADRMGFAFALLYYQTRLNLEDSKSSFREAVLKEIKGGAEMAIDNAYKAFIKKMNEDEELWETK